MKLRVVSNYSNQSAAYVAGQIIDVDDVQARWLQADAPGVFEPYTEPKRETADKAVEAPVQDKMQRRTSNKRGKASN